MEVRRLQSVALWCAVLFGVLAIMASTGYTPIPRGFPRLAPFLFPLVVGLGVAGGVLTMARRREIETERWRIVEDSTLTSGERDHAHREAERELRVSATIFLLASLALGAWLAYQLKLEDQFTSAELLTIAPLPGFGIGLVLGRRKTS